MAGLFDNARDYAQNHLISVATGLLIVLPGTYLLISGNSISCAVGVYSKLSTPSYPVLIRPTEELSVYQTSHSLYQHLSLPISQWNDIAATFIFQVLQGIRKDIISVFIATGERLGNHFHYVFRNLDDRWASHFPLSRFVLVAAATALPGAFLAFIQNYPTSWASKHQTQITNTLHILALITVANQQVSVQDFLVIALIMASFETFQRFLRSANAEGDKDSSAIETPLARAQSTLVESDDQWLPNTVESVPKNCSALSHNNTPTCEEEEISRLQRSLTEAKTAKKVKEIELKRAQTDLRNARDTLNETFAEYTSLRDEMKTMKKTAGRDHQTIIYGKDIQLFALRKGNDQKENIIKDKDAKMADLVRVHKTTLALKDAQTQNLKERVTFLETTNNTCNIDGEVRGVGHVEGDQAVQVKLLRVKGRNSLDIEQSVEDKDAEISKLKGNLAGAVKASETMARTEDELRRAWNATYELQNTLSEEQQIHAQTKEKLQEISCRLDEEVKKQSDKSSSTRLPTIEEQDKRELETIFNAAQQDNLRLYSELDVLDKRLREANARAFVYDQEVDQLREQLRLEKAVNEDMETARPSLVHRVHFQRMEGQLKESRDAISEKEDEILLLKEDIAAKDKDIVDLEKANESVLSDCSTLQAEREELKRTIHSLETTKEQLMLDHERLAAQRYRQRNTSADHASSRSSGATLTDPQSNLQVITNDAEDEPLPPTRPVSMVKTSGLADEPDGGSIQNTPASTYRSPLAARDQRISMISDKAPPKELRGTHSKRQSLKGFIRKVVGKDTEGEKKEKGSSKSKSAAKLPARPQTALAPKPKAPSALAPKDKNTLMRPKTAASGLKLDTSVESGKALVKAVQRPQTSGPSSTPKTIPSFSTSSTKATTPETSTPSRYFAAHENQPKEDKTDAGVDTSNLPPRPKSSGWSTSRKLVRTSVD